MSAQGDVSRRNVLALAGASTITAAGAVTVGLISPDARAWARPTIYAAIGVPAAVASPPPAEYRIDAFVSSRIAHKPWTPADGARPVGFETYTWTGVITGTFPTDSESTLKVTPGIAPEGSLQFSVAYNDIPLNVTDSAHAIFTVPNVPETSFRGNRPIVGTSLEAPQVGGEWTEIIEPAPNVFRATSGTVAEDSSLISVELQITGMDESYALSAIELDYELDTYTVPDLPDLANGTNTFTLENRYPRQPLTSVTFNFNTPAGVRRVYLLA
ncbi:hypothetical protein [Microbacterium sp. SGAir0570]|uniref:hypothetical protein n=1 Tax=Microbacterium sp. SGAir0570 TaxID=2070348 RepID=UPI00215B2647|nr:hypothetical protein [Microbacterium sp. SGAir0570]